MKNTVVKQLRPVHLEYFKNLGNSLNRLSLNLAVFDSNFQVVLLCECPGFKSGIEKLKSTALIAYREADKSQQQLYINKIDQIIGVVTKTADMTEVILLIYSDKAVSDESEKLIKEMLSLFCGNLLFLEKTEDEIENVSTELAHTYEELVLLHKISTNMKVTENNGNFLQLACDSLTEIVSVEGIAILLEQKIYNEKRLSLFAGSGIIDINDNMIALLQSRLEEEIFHGKEALLDSDVESDFKYDWPGNIRSIIAVPMCGKDNNLSRNGIDQNRNIIGIMVAINRIDKPDFDSTDVTLFNSVTNSCAVFVENGRLFKDLKELFIGSLKALANSIDAKDPYTRGHSDRVAFIARWIAEQAQELQFSEDDIHRIYLAGMLHDIGKIGINDAVLCKKGKLTAEEYEVIKKHPSIGADILNEIKQMRDIVPGVLFHHERIDGKGYPYGLPGDQIPIIGKIIQLADSFDAMTSMRTYKNALTLEHAINEIKNGLGTQFDTQIGNIFINSDINRLWEIIWGHNNDLLVNDEFSEYGSIAVGTIIK